MREIYIMRYQWLLVICGLSVALGARAQSPACNGMTWAELQGDVDPAQHASFSAIPSGLTNKPNIYLRTEALTALESMAQAASADGVRLEVVSAMRTWSHQRRIWNGKWNSPRFMGFTGAERATEILRYSSMPGTSRHHWGTDVDLNALENSYFETGTGANTYAWLQANAADFGFVQVYGDQSNGRTGYQEEKWHWSFWPLSDPYLQCYLALRPAVGLDGFEGAEFGDTLQVIDRYVRGIDAPR